MKKKITLADIRTKAKYKKPSVTIRDTMCCGLFEISGLERATPMAQAAQLLSAIEGAFLGEEELNGWRNGETRDDQVGQLLLTDITTSASWAETKKIARKGPISRNPNTGNNIRVYIVTKPMILKIANS